MSIILIGYRGSGKTTVGRLLATRLAWSFVDLDEQIVGRAGLTIKQIFEHHGEAEFRRIETAEFAAALPAPNHVISVGGGAVLAQSNRALVAQSGHQVVYLRTNAAELHRRIVGDPATAVNRPSLTGLSGGIEEIRAVLAEREPVYRALQTVEIDVTEKSPEQVVDNILGSGAV